MESLERAVQEIDCLAAIYGSDDSDSFTVHSEDRLLAARSAVDAAAHIDAAWSPPILDIELRNLPVGAAGVPAASLRCVLPPGYPSVPAVVTPTIAGLKKASAAHALVVEALTERAAELAEAEAEAVLELVQLVQDLGTEQLQQQADGAQHSAQAAPPAVPLPRAAAAAGAAQAPAAFGRRWIWVHHIVDAQRRKDIASEARERALGGYLKSGYPGIVVVEGSAAACVDFVRWIKGNKSRPGGFGRQWGHHVRGEVNINVDVDGGVDSGGGSAPADAGTGAVAGAGTEGGVGAQGGLDLDRHRRLPAQFAELEEMAALGRECKACGLEDEFKDYVITSGSAKQR